MAPRTILKADRSVGVITLDSDTQLAGVPPEVWAYRLGNRTALEWVLDQHKEKTPKDPPSASASTPTGLLSIKRRLSTCSCA
jgi:predicted helicase